MFGGQGHAGATGGKLLGSSSLDLLVVHSHGEQLGDSGTVLGSAEEGLKELGNLSEIPLRGVHEGSLQR
eukprot:gene1339-biopygen10855